MRGQNIRGFLPIPGDAVIGMAEDGCLTIRIHCDHGLSPLHADRVLHGSRKAEADIQSGADDDPRLPDLMRISGIARIHGGACGAYGTSDPMCQGKELVKAPFASDAHAARENHIRILQGNGLLARA